MSSSIDDETHDSRVVSPQIDEAIREILYQDEQVESQIPADLSLNGMFQPSALYVTNRRLISYDQGHADGHILHVPREQVENAEIETMYGNSLLRVTVQGKPIVLNRFTYAVLDLFDAARIRILSDTSHEKGLQKQAEFRCSSCGRPKRTKGAVCPFCIDKRKVLTRLLGYVRPHLKLTLVGLLTAAVATGASLVPPYLTKVLVDEVVLNKDLQLLQMVIIALALVHVIHAVFSMARSYLLQSLGKRIVFDLRTEVFAKLQTLSLEYYDKQRTGAIMSRVSNDTQRLQGFLLQISQNLIIQLLTLVFIGVVMIGMSWQLAVLTLLPVPIVAFGAKHFARKIHPVYHRVWRRLAMLNATLSDAVSGTRVIKAFTGEDREIERFVSQGSDLLAEELRAAKMASIFRPAVHFFMTLGGLIVWGLGGYWVISGTGDLTLGTLVAFLSYLARFYGPIEFLAGLTDLFQQAATASERVFDILDTDEEANYNKGLTLGKHIQGRIEFKNVSFDYDAEKHALKDVSLVVEPGQTIGLVGATGAGKTTMANLVLGYYEPDRGQILIDGMDMAKIDVRSLRENIGIVLQQPLLFHDTIANNISYGKPTATIEEIVQAAKVANAHDFIAQMPEAYDTRLGERGVGLSGGEQQRISIARAILKDPSVLVLDEATSAVDTETEKLIQEAINRLIKDRTTLIIAHRLSTLRNADKVVVLEDGEIVEAGTHDELMIQQGIFYKLVKMQADMGTDLLRVG